jgi:hypothetical protein
MGKNDKVRGGREVLLPVTGRDSNAALCVDFKLIRASARSHPIP